MGAEHESADRLSVTRWREAFGTDAEGSGNGLAETGLEDSVFFGRLALEHVEVELGAVECLRRDDGFVVHDAQFTLQILEHRPRSRTRQCQQRWCPGPTPGGFAGCGSDAQVCGAEVVAPFGDAVGLVDRDEAHGSVDGHCSNRPAELFHLEAFRGDVVDEVFTAGKFAVGHVLDVARAHIAAEPEYTVNAVAPEATYLVTDERNNWSDDDRSSRQQ